MAIACGLLERESSEFAIALGTPVTVLPDVAALMASLRAERSERLVVLGPSVPDHQVWRFAARARFARPDLVLAALRPMVNRLQRQLGKEAGLDAVLPADDIAAAGHSCRELLGASLAGRRGRIVTVLAGKGGCGTTTLSVNLAVALADHAAHRVCLVDFDLRSGGVAAMLGLEPADSRSADPTVGARAAVTSYRPRLDCLLAPTRPGAAERLETEDVGPLLDALSTRYDVVLVDTPAAFTAPVLTALDRSEHHVLVTTPERPALQSLRRTLDAMDLLGHRRDIRSVVFNRSDSAVGITADGVERTLRAPIAAHVPSSRDVPASINSYLPLAVTSPGHPVSSAVRRFAVARVAPAARHPLRSGAP